MFAKRFFILLLRKYYTVKLRRIWNCKES